MLHIRWENAILRSFSYETFSEKMAAQRYVILVCIVLQNIATKAKLKTKARCHSCMGTVSGHLSTAFKRRSCSIFRRKILKLSCFSSYYKSGHFSFTMSATLVHGFKVSLRDGSGWPECNHRQLTFNLVDSLMNSSLLEIPDCVVCYEYIIEPSVGILQNNFLLEFSKGSKDLAG